VVEDWAAYLCLVNDAPASIFLDLSLKEVAPQTERPQLLWVWVGMLKPREDGLSSKEESPQLLEIGHELEAVLASGLDAIEAGRITNVGRREFYFYAPASGGFDEAVHQAMVRYPEYRYDYGEQSDPQWSQYLEVLYPSDVDLRRIENRRVVETLKEHGDALQVPREVDHHLYFPTEQSRQAFVLEVRREGFAVRNAVGGDNADDGRQLLELHISRCDAVDQDSIDAVVIGLMERAKALGGQYDGWGAPVMREGPKEGYFKRLLWKK
jgi:regulator of RNase E activity RraB